MRSLSRCLIALAVWSAPAAAHAVYGGSVVEPDEGEAAVRLTWRRGGHSGECSGVLIDPKTVLTAAHCVRSSRGKAYRVKSVRIGNPRGRTTRVKVAAVRVHPKYDPKRPERGHDLAVLRLKKAVKGHRPIPMATAEQDPTSQGERLTITGFGVTQKNGRMVKSRKLRMTSQEYLSPFHCFSGPVHQMAQTRMCAASPDSGVCPGDSGAPASLQVDGRQVLVGVVSLAIDVRKCSNTATVLTRVSTFREWVLEGAEGPF